MGKSREVQFAATTATKLGVVGKRRASVPNLSASIIDVSPSLPSEEIHPREGEPSVAHPAPDNGVEAPPTTQPEKVVDGNASNSSSVPLPKPKAKGKGRPKGSKANRRSEAELLVLDPMVAAPVGDPAFKIEKASDDFDLPFPDLKFYREANIPRRNMDGSLTNQMQGIRPGCKVVCSLGWGKPGEEEVFVAAMQATTGSASENLALTYSPTSGKVILVDPICEIVKVWKLANVQIFIDEGSYLIAEDAELALREFVRAKQEELESEKTKKRAKREEREKAEKTRQTKKRKTKENKRAAPTAGAIDYHGIDFSAGILGPIGKFQNEAENLKRDLDLTNEKLRRCQFKFDLMKSTFEGYIKIANAFLVAAKVPPLPEDVFNLSKFTLDDDDDLKTLGSKIGKRQ
jgi:hypothetical protein